MNGKRKRVGVNEHGHCVVCGGVTQAKARYCSSKCIEEAKTIERAKQEAL